MNRYKSPISVTHPELAAEAVGWNSSTLTAGSVKKMGWQCKYGHKWNASVSSRSNGTGCPFCSGFAVLAGFNDLATVNPELAAQADAWDASTVSAGSNKKMGWKCKHGHKWNAPVLNRSNGSGCPICSNKKVLPGFNDLATTNPELAAQADGWDTSKFTAGSAKKVKWQCTVGHIYSARIFQRTLGTGCPVCSNKQVLIGFNDLATTHPEIAAQADGWDSTLVAAGSTKRHQWRCDKGHQWITPLYCRLKNSCPYCSNSTVLIGYNDLATTHPELAAEADCWDPTTLIAGSNKKRKWRCSEGHTWNAAVGTRSIGPKGGSGCPSCAKRGFNPSLTGWLYFLEHDGWNLFQIGITTNPNKRIRKHILSGWTSIEIRGPMDGALAKSFEISILKSLKIRGATMAHKTDIQKFDGWTEAWTKDSLSVTSFKQLLDWVYQDDEKQLMTKAL